VKVLAHLSGPLRLEVIRAGGGERMQTVSMARHGDVSVGESDEIEEADVLCVVRGRPHVLERDERTRSLVTNDELSHVRVVGTRQPPATVEAVHLVVAEGEVRGRTSAHDQPADHGSSDGHCTLVRIPATRRVPEIPQPESGQHREKGKCGQVEPVPTHLIGAHRDDVEHEADRDRSHHGFLESVLAVREGQGRQDHQAADPVELEHADELVQAGLDDECACAGLDVEGIREKVAEVEVAEEMCRCGDGEQAGKPKQGHALELASANRSPKHWQRKNDSDQVDLGTGDATETHHDARTQREPAVLPRQRFEGQIEGESRQEHAQGLLHAAGCPEGRGAGAGKPDRGPDVRKVQLDAMGADVQLRHQEQQAAEHGGTENLEDLKQIEPECFEWQRDEDPQECRGTLELLAGIENQAVAEQKVLGVAPGDVCVVLHEVEVYQDAGQQQQPGEQQRCVEQQPGVLYGGGPSIIGPLRTPEASGKEDRQ